MGSINQHPRHSSKEVFGNNAHQVAAVARDAIISLMSRCEIPQTSHPQCRMREVERRLRDACATRNLDSAILYEQSVLVGVTIANTAYAHCHVDVQVYIATYTLLAMLLDNFSVSPEALTAYITGEAVAGEPILEWLTECILQSYNYYVPFAADAIVISTKKWLNSLQLDNLVGGARLTVRNMRFAEYRRMQSGDPEAYTFFMFDKSSFPDVTRYIQVIPDAAIVINYVNDITSFYKEELSGESDTYVRDRASASGKPYEIVLHELVEETADAYKNVIRILDGTPEAEIWKRFTTGYFYFHVYSSRYRLKELDIFVVDVDS